MYRWSISETRVRGDTDWDAVQSSLDATGIVDPTPISDGVNAVISVARGNYVDAGLSAVAIVPYIGDLAKGGKYLDEAAAGARWVGDKADEGWQAAKRWTDCLINSFSAKTLVMTPAGLKAISDLVEGELVLAYNEATGQIGAYPITDVISHVDPEIVLLTIDGETLETKAEHPFYELESAPPALSEVEGWLAVGQTEGRWTDALDLQAGDRVWKADGSSGVVQSVEVAPVQQRMYNLTVAEAHTFFVGDGQWLVHNCGEAKNFDEARRLAFEKAGLTNPEDVLFTKVDPVTGTVVEFKGPNGAKVSYDAPHSSPGAGHDMPHVGWQSAGKRGQGLSRGNITYNGPQHPYRSPIKGQGVVGPH